MKTQSYMFLLSLYQKKTTKKCQNFLGLKDHCTERNVKQKVRIKTVQMNIDINANQTL